ncbi:MAG TPA: hypothetical protein VJ732_15380 [Bryobacteraceae bacterium]|nr:hypothetical protein [Bryobacteraceae bacterium]
MPRVINFVPRVAIFLAGMAAGVLTAPRRERGAAEPEGLLNLQRSLAELESRLAAQQAASTTRFGAIEARLEEHTAKLADMPSTSQIVAAMEQLLSKTMVSLDERLTAQAHSIEVLKTTVSQTDSLLERVLESLDSLQVSDTGDLPADSLLERPAV